jgi:hypothetical protein
MTSYNSDTQTEIPCVNQAFKKEMGVRIHKEEKKMEKGRKKNRNGEKREEDRRGNSGRGLEPVGWGGGGDMCLWDQ